MRGENEMKLKRAFRMAAIALAGLFVPRLAFSQGCALCYTQAASAGNRMIQALQSGILILIVPPTIMSVAMIFVVYRKRNQFRRDDSTRSTQWSDREFSWSRRAPTDGE
jgi:hypothetical protein